MNTGEKQRTAWLDAMADYVLEHGLDAASLRPLAKAAGTSDRMLLYYFADKNALITAILDHVAMRLTVLMIAQGAADPVPFDACLARTVDILGDDVFAPYMRLFLQIASLAAQNDALYRAIGENLGRMYFAWAQGQLASRDDAARDHEAALLIQRIEGMVFLRAIGLEDINRLAFGRAV